MEWLHREKNMYKGFIHLNVRWFLEEAMTSNSFAWIMYACLTVCFPQQVDKIWARSHGRKFVFFISQLNLSTVEHWRVVHLVWFHFRMNAFHMNLVMPFSFFACITKFKLFITLPLPFVCIDSTFVHYRLVYWELFIICLIFQYCILRDCVCFT